MTSGIPTLSSAVSLGLTWLVFLLFRKPGLQLSYFGLRSLGPDRNQPAIGIVKSEPGGLDA